MIYLIIGFAFVYLDIGIAINELGTVEILPDCIGWFFVFYGLIKLSPIGVNFAKVKYISLVTGLLSVITWVLDAIGVSKFFGVFTLPLLAVICFLTLFITYRIVEGIGDAENDNNADYGSKRLYKLFLPLCVTQSVTLLAGVFGMRFIWIAATVALYVCTALLTVFLYKTKTAFDQKPPKVIKKETDGDKDSEYNIE